MNTQLLALPSSNLPIVYRHPMSATITSLAYIDKETDLTRQKQVRTYYLSNFYKVQMLIQNEMKQMTKRDYLEEIPMPKSLIEGN